MKWVLSEYRNQLEFIPENINGILAKNGIKTDYLETVIDWQKVENKYCFFFDYMGNEDIIGFLQNSEIAKYDHLIVFLDNEDPLIKIETDTFIKHWEDFLSSTGFMGMVAITEDGKYFLEFTDDDCYNLCSNFLIKPEK